VGNGVLDFGLFLAWPEVALLGEQRNDLCLACIRQGKVGEELF